jgi:kynureninase
LVLASPRDPHARGSQVSFRFAEGYAATQALIARGIVGAFRAPDVMRFGFAPLYVTPADVIKAARMIETVIRERLWDRPEYARRQQVT